MSTERHVCSLALSRKLAEAGFQQECVMAWYAANDMEHYATLNAGPHESLVCAAPLLSEIMEQMPGMRVQVEYTAEAGMWWNAAFGNRGESRTGRSGQDAAGALWLALRGEK